MILPSLFTSVGDLYQGSSFLSLIEIHSVCQTILQCSTFVEAGVGNEKLTFLKFFFVKKKKAMSLGNKVTALSRRRHKTEQKNKSLQAYSNESNTTVQLNHPPGQRHGCFLTGSTDSDVTAAPAQAAS